MSSKVKDNNPSMPRRARNCPIGKINYISKKIALAHAAKSAITLTPYKCNHCKKWHLTSTPAYVKEESFQQLLYRECVLIQEGNEGWWRCDSIPGRHFATIAECKHAVNEYLKEVCA